MQAAGDRRDHPRAGADTRARAAVSRRSAARAQHRRRRLRARAQARRRNDARRARRDGARYAYATRSRRSISSTLRRSRSRSRAGLRRAAQRPAARPLHSAGGARGLSRHLRRPARSAALPDPPAEHQRARHPDGGTHPPVPGLRRDDAAHAARAGRRVPADGRRADRDQVAPAAAAASRAARRRTGGSARRAGAPPARIRADEGRRRGRSTRMPLAERDFALVRVWFERVAAARLPDVHPDDLRRRGRGWLRGRGSTGIISSPASSCRCARR